MGAAASLSGDTGIDLGKAKELAGERWTAELEEKFNAILSEKGSLTLNDIKSASPELFGHSHNLLVDEDINIGKAKELAIAVGVEWNDALNSIFTENLSAETQSLPLSKWKSLVPTLFETQDERLIRLEAEFQVVLATRAEGNVVINYQMYNEEFPVSGNTLTAERIDEDYGLTDVMPGCRIRLSAIEPKGRTLFANAHDGQEAPYVKEDPIGTFKELLAGETYYCIIIENPEQYEKDMHALQTRFAADGPLTDNDRVQRAQEGCSCLFGNPCMDQYICKDWDNRLAVAKTNGWKGF